MLASGSKDRSARLWAPIVGDSGNWGSVGVCEGHAESVGAIAVSRGSSENGHPNFMFTGSQDRTIKMWDLSGVPLIAEEDGREEVKCKSLTTHKAHEKDINSLDISPNDRLLASGSQDRTTKVYEIEYVAGSGGKAPRGEIKLLGTCKGHKRGVWNVRFGRTERVLATGSGDKTVKLWSLEDFSCVKTFEGHTNSVLRVDFINAGMQLVSAASDGLVKLWNVREEECVATMDNHEDKVGQGLYIQAIMLTSSLGLGFGGQCRREDNRFWSCRLCRYVLGGLYGGAGNGEGEQTRRNGAQVSSIVVGLHCLLIIFFREQDFLNYLSLNDYRRAIELALAMEQPGRLLSLFTNISSQSTDDVDQDPSPPSVTGHHSVDEVIRTLGGADLAKLLRYIRDWNAKARTSGVAQGVLYAVVKLRSAEDVMRAFGDDAVEATLTGKAGGTSLKELVDGLIPYTERHLARMERLVQESYVVDYILGEMDDGMFSGDFEDDGEYMDVDANPLATRV